MREDALDLRRAHKGVHDRRGVGCGDEKVDVADRLAIAAAAPADRDLRDVRALAQGGDYLVRGGARVMDERPSGALPQRGDRLEDVLLGLRLDLGQLAESAGLGRFLELVDRGDAELLVDRAGGR